MIAVDTNILVHAHRTESPWHAAAQRALAGVAQGAWAIPWPCLHEFLAIVTHPKIFNPPTPLATARKTARVWQAAPTIRLLGELAGYGEVLDGLLERSKVTGPRVHDAHIVALCVQHGVSVLWTADRDFSRFAGALQTANPLLADSPG